MQDPVFVQRAFSRIADRYVLTNHVLSLGTDILWRRKVARLVAGYEPRRILDLATGSGDLAAEILKVVPTSTMIGADFCQPMLAHARRRGLRDLIVADGLALPFEDAAFDAVTVAFGLRNMADWDAALREMARVLVPQGRLVILDFSIPDSLLKRPYRLYLHRVLPFLAGALTGQGDAYRYLSESIEKFPSGEAMCDLMRRNGLQSAASRPLSLGIASVYVAVR